MNSPKSNAVAATQPSSITSLHALVAIARRYGMEISIEQITRTFALDGGEPSTAMLVAIAKQIGLEAKSVRLKFRDLPQIAKTLPAILRANDSTAVILESVQVDPVKGAIALIKDPTNDAAESVAIDELRLSDVWNGEIILVKRQFSVDDDQKPFGMTWIIAQVFNERRLFVDIGAAALVGTIFALAPAFAVMIVVNRVLANHSTSTLEVIGGALLLLILFETILTYLRRIFVQVVTTRIEARLNLYVVQKLLKLPVSFFEKNPTGLITSKIGQLYQIRQFFTGQLLGAFLDAVPMLGLIPVMIILKWQLALLVFVLSAIVFVIVSISLGPISRRYKRVILAEHRKGSHLVETIHGVRTIKSLVLEGRRQREWDRRVAESAIARHEFGLTANTAQTITLPFERLIYTGSLLLGAILALKQPEFMSPGALVAFLMLAQRLASPLIQIAKMQLDIAEVRGAVAQLATIMNVPAEEERSSNGLRLPIKGEVTFQDVRFRYGADSPYALDGVSFTLAPGKMLGVVGRSGSGKSTLTRLLQGLYSKYEGMIKIDGMDLREIDLQHLRTNLGIVLQENFLFSGTIRENIAMARPDAPFSSIVKAAQMAGAEEFIERLPRGYDTYLEEGAVNLSGGQRQRLAIARSILINPPVLMLDEATSALDAESEAIVNANLKRIAEGRTIISISHRLSMLVQSDVILVMEKGRVYDMGTHDELLDRCDIYQQLWYQQNSHLNRNNGTTQAGAIVHEGR